MTSNNIALAGIAQTLAITPADFFNNLDITHVCLVHSILVGCNHEMLLVRGKQKKSGFSEHLNLSRKRETFSVSRAKHDSDSYAVMRNTGRSTIVVALSSSTASMHFIISSFEPRRMILYYFILYCGCSRLPHKRRSITRIGQASRKEPLSQILSHTTIMLRRAPLR